MSYWLGLILEWCMWYLGYYFFPNASICVCWVVIYSSRSYIFVAIFWFTADNMALVNPVALVSNNYFASYWMFLCSSVLFWRVSPLYIFYQCFCILFVLTYSSYCAIPCGLLKTFIWNLFIYFGVFVWSTSLSLRCWIWYYWTGIFPP